MGGGLITADPAYRGFMSGIRSITRRPTVVGAAADASAPIFVDSDDNKVHVLAAGAGTTTDASLHDSVTQPLTTLNIGTKTGSTISVVEAGNGILHQTIITFTALPLTVLDVGTGVGQLVYTFPQGDITIIGGSMSIAETTTSALAGTWHSNVAYTYALGTVTQAAGTTLATTECDIIPGTAGIAGVTSTTVSVAAVAAIGSRTIAPANHVGHTTAIACFFNVATAAADIDANATALFSGTATITWTFNGDV